MPLLVLCVAATVAKTPDEILQQNLASYSSITRPSAALAPDGCTAAPDEVQIGFYVQGLGAVDMKSLSYTVEGYLRFYWNDPRLAFNSSACGTGKLLLRSPSFGGKNLWTPDAYFEKAIDVTFKHGLESEMVSISPEGDVFWSRQARATLRCAMGFGRLPYDEQHCLFLAGMYSETAAEVLLTWKSVEDALGGVSHVTALASGDFEISGVKADNILDVYTSANYSYAKACVSITRNSKGSYDLTIVLSILYVLLSYCGFWISAAAAPGRIALAVICVLITVNSFYSVKSSLPETPYPVWMLIFLFGSAMFNVIAFIEYAVVNFGMTTSTLVKQLADEKQLQDDDDDGQLDWSELRAAEEHFWAVGLQAVDLDKLQTKSKQKGAMACSMSRLLSRSAKVGPADEKCSAAPAAPPPHRPAPTVSSQPPDADRRISMNFQVQDPGMRERTTVKRWNSSFCSSLSERIEDSFPSLRLFKPVGVSKLRHADRPFRLYFLPAFFLYVAVMFALNPYIPTSAEPVASESHQCPF